MSIDDIDRAILMNLTEEDKKIVIELLKSHNIDIKTIKPFYLLTTSENKNHEEFISFPVQDQTKVEQILLNFQTDKNTRDKLKNYCGYKIGYSLKEDFLDQDTAEVLRKCNLSPHDNLNICDNHTAISILLAVMAEYLPSMDIHKLTPADWNAILNDYAGAIIDYHPENDHQARWALEQHKDVLERCGATEDEIESLEFS